LRKHSISTNKIAEICGVSQGTVDRALNNRSGINPKTKEKILRVAKEYGYHPNIHARAIAGGKTMLIGVIVFDLNNRYFTEFITCFEKLCSSSGYSIITMFTDKDPKREVECIKTLYDMAVDGIVICPINKGESYENFLLSLDTPIITVGNRLLTIKHSGLNDQKAMSDATSYVIKRGYEELIYVMPTLDSNINSSAQQERLLGFKKAVDKSSVKYSVTDIQGAIEHGDFEKKTAYICSTDVYALRIAGHAKSIGAGLIGFDNIDLIDLPGLGFDSVAADTRSIALGALEYITKGKCPDTTEHFIKERGSV
jgi:LacI family transcriptional regulator